MNVFQRFFCYLCLQLLYNLNGQLHTMHDIPHDAIILVASFLPLDHISILMRINQHFYNVHRYPAFMNAVLTSIVHAKLTGAALLHFQIKFLRTEVDVNLCCAIDTYYTQTALKKHKNKKKQKLTAKQKDLVKRDKIILFLNTVKSIQKDFNSRLERRSNRHSFPLHQMQSLGVLTSLKGISEFTLHYAPLDTVNMSVFRNRKRKPNFASQKMIVNGWELDIIELIEKVNKNIECVEIGTFKLHIRPLLHLFWTIYLCV
jgi:hypothetical protein